MMYFIRHHNHGFVALTAVLVLSALFLSISISIATHAIATTRAGIALSAQQKAHGLAHLCAEYALIELLRTLDYDGDESITVGELSCDILAISGSGNTNRTLKTQSTVAGHTQRLQIVVSSISPDMTISSWDKVTQF